jgi:uncharacterized membrane protein YeaQ/YmgE (transglycosylase-associated protein family)
MLKRLVHIAGSRWTKILIVLLWILSLLLMIERGWVKESWENQSGGGSILTGRNYFDIHRNALFVWMTLILIGYLAHKFKQRSLGYFGLVEILVGIVGGYVALERVTLDQAASWFAVLASAYVVVRGAGNIAQAVKIDEKQN